MPRWFKLTEHERGFLFRGQEFLGILETGRHWRFDPLRRLRLDRASFRNVWIEHPDLEVIVKKNVLGAKAEILNLKDHERALVWVDGRFEAVRGPGLCALWQGFHDIRYETIPADKVRELLFQHQDLHVILSSRSAHELLEPVSIPAHCVGLLFKNGNFAQVLSAGTHAFWKGEGEVRVVPVDLRDQLADASVQEIWTSDNVKVRADAVVTFRVIDAKKAVTEVRDYMQAVNRRTQLALKAAVGTNLLADLLAKKAEVSGRIEQELKPGLESYGIELRSVGIDVVPQHPGGKRPVLASGETSIPAGPEQTSGTAS